VHRYRIDNLPANRHLRVCRKGDEQTRDDTPDHILIMTPR